MSEPCGKPNYSENCDNLDKGCGNCPAVNKALSNRITLVVKALPCPTGYKLHALIHSAMDYAYQETADPEEALMLVHEYVSKAFSDIRRHHIKVLAAMPQWDKK